MTSRRVNCVEFVHRLADYLEDALGRTELQMMAAHAELCPGCARYLAQLLRVRSLLSSLDVAESKTAGEGSLRALVLEFVRLRPSAG